MHERCGHAAPALSMPFGAVALLENGSVQQSGNLWRAFLFEVPWRALAFPTQ